MNSISPKEAFKKCQSGAIILDVRMEYLTAYKKFDVETLILIPYKQIESDHHSIPKNKNVIIADSTGIKSKEIYEKLWNYGYTKIFNLAGGLVEWERDGLPIIINNKKRLSGSCMCQLRTRENK
ncbi:MAG: rhodanese-like domain-containing protein [Salinivirgaceae bacterium]|nr:rhodanese-like domain-containing protein [Salinivirgaceae bacterium]